MSYKKRIRYSPKRYLPRYVIIRYRYIPRNKISYLLACKSQSDAQSFCRRRKPSSYLETRVISANCLFKRSHTAIPLMRSSQRTFCLLVISTVITYNSSLSALRVGPTALNPSGSAYVSIRNNMCGTDEISGGMWKAKTFTS